MENLKRKKKKGQKKLTLRSGDLNLRFSVIIPPMIWIFMESEEPEIKPKQASKRDRTLESFWLRRKWVKTHSIKGIISTRVWSLKITIFKIRQIVRRYNVFHSNFYEARMNDSLPKIFINISMVTNYHWF